MWNKRIKALLLFSIIFALGTTSVMAASPEKEEYSMTIMNENYKQESLNIDSKWGLYDSKDGLITEIEMSSEDELARVSIKEKGKYIVKPISLPDKYSAEDMEFEIPLKDENGKENEHIVLTPKVFKETEKEPTTPIEVEEQDYTKTGTSKSIIYLFTGGFVTGVSLVAFLANRHNKKKK